MPVIISGDSGITTPTYGGTDTSEYLVPVTAFKNRIINGAMMIDQRNAGAAQTINTNGRTYILDRYQGQATPSAGVFTVQRSTTAPSGFINSLLVTVTTADSSLAAGDLYVISQDIEGFNIADLGFGTASASTVTLSFWVRSSVTGTFGGALGNNNFNRSYPFTYTISSANTWEQKTITIAGDTTGTWLTDNSIGIRVYLAFGCGSTYSGTAGAWTGSGLLTATGATNLMATSGATFYITGVQLEKGSTATSFDYRPYGQELNLCQRYYTRLTSGNAASGGIIGMGVTLTTTATVGLVPFRQQMRATPTISQSNMIVSDSLVFDAAVSAITGVGTYDSLYVSLTHAAATSGKTVSIRSAAGGTGFIAFDSEL